MMKSVSYLVTLAMLDSAFPLLASAFDPSPLQDFCVAINDSSSAVFVNGKFCKDPNLATADDFFLSGIDIPRSTSNPLGSNVTRITVDQIPGLNTLGISLARIDFAPYGVNPPHTHPRATEVLVVLEDQYRTNQCSCSFPISIAKIQEVITIANAIFGSNPPINPDVLTKAFQLDKDVINYLQKQLWWNND
uniref:Cupin type-1 domain-containing protein n=1 Tax=Fagus sylvatica TaxID=28930 RepID=A0A2N9ELC0_FAGSY